VLLKDYAEDLLQVYSLLLQEVYFGVVVDPKNLPVVFILYVFCPPKSLNFKCALLVKFYLSKPSYEDSNSF